MLVYFEKLCLVSSSIQAGQKIRRERVPFVLSPDFVHMMGGKVNYVQCLVLCNDQTFFTQDGVAFSRFREVCSEAYAVLRSQTNLFINLFHMVCCHT